MVTVFARDIHFNEGYRSPAADQRQEDEAEGVPRRREFFVHGGQSSKSSVDARRRKGGRKFGRWHAGY